MYVSGNYEVPDVGSLSVITLYSKYLYIKQVRSNLLPFYGSVVYFIPIQENCAASRQSHVVLGVQRKLLMYGIL